MKGQEMSITIEQAFAQAVNGLGPVAAALVQREYPTSISFAPFFPILQEELEVLAGKVNILSEQAGAVFRADTVAQAWTVATCAREWGYGIQAQQAAVPVASAPQMPTLIVPPTLGQPQIASGPVVAQASASPAEVWPDPFGSEACYNRGCGMKFATFREAMAHKVLVHGYNAPKYSPSWAKEVAENQVKAGTLVPPSAWVMTQTVASAPPDPQGPVVAQGTGINMLEVWKPTLNLDLRGLDLQLGEASRFAVGDDHDARFYFVRLLRAKTTIKGQFVWSRFAHRFTTTDFYSDNFVVRKMAGDTKEWIGAQSPQGVWMSAKRAKMYENTYVGSHELDIAEILQDPYAARVKYGKLIGACGYCGRKLTDPVSRLRGIGPDCWDAKGFSAYMHRPQAVKP